MTGMNEDHFVEDINSNIGLIHKICSVYFSDSNDRQDAFQEILYQLWRSYASFTGGSKFSTWMYKVALNTAITYARKSKNQPAGYELPDQLHQLSETNEQQQLSEKMEWLYAAINELNVIDKAIILLYLEDNSYEEIASITGLTKTNVSVRLVRIKLALKEKLKNIF